MTKSRICATATGLPANATITDCQHDAVILAEIVEAIDLLTNEGKRFDSVRFAITEVALEKARKLADDLDVLS
ncbi:MAG TPA: hypothetical protein DIT67_06680 [Octadecabacter sp.]|nr:hypothetical protein [Octadecabacter sp.]